MIDLSLYEWPLSLLLAAAFAAGAVWCALSLPDSRLRSLLYGRAFATALLLLMAAALAVEGTWKLDLFRSWGWLALVLAAALALGGCCTGRGRGRSLASWGSHAGLFVVLVAGSFGAADTESGQLAATADKPTHYAVTARGETLPLPFEVRLVEFRTDYYPDGKSPKQYSSRLMVDGRPMTTSVNHPCRWKGYRIYQSDYDRAEGRYSVLKVVRDPWLPAVWAGMTLMALAAVAGLRRTWESHWVLPAAAALAAVFALLSLARIRFGTLMPALRSLWFVPHLIIYMISYSLLAIALVLSVLSHWLKRLPEGLAGRLLATASSLLLLGMLCGAVWAKAAWGDYWTWDAKECWAAATWLLTLAGTHLPARCRHGWATAATLAAFLAMQVTWYGVNYLPSARHSLHTYTAKP